MLALREGRIGDADVLRRAREAAVAPPPAPLTPVAEDPGAIVADVPPDATPPAADAEAKDKVKDKDGASVEGR